MRTRVTIQHFDGCPGWTLARSNLREAARAIAVELDVTEQAVETVEDAERLGFVGSPTVLIEGVDPFASPAARPALACRLYETPEGPAGAPTVGQLVDALRAAHQANQRPAAGRRSSVALDPDHHVTVDGLT